MIKTDEEALICDLAETYQIYDYKILPLRTVSTLACGLRENSRIKLKVGGIKNIPPIILVNALIADILNNILHALSGDKRQVESLVDMILGIEKQGQIKSYMTPEEWNEKKKKIIHGAIK